MISKTSTVNITCRFPFLRIQQFLSRCSSVVHNQTLKSLVSLWLSHTLAHLSSSDACMQGHAVVVTCGLVGPVFVLLWYFLSSCNVPAQGKGRNRNQEIWISPSSCRGAVVLGAAVYSASFNLPSGCNLLWFTQGEQRLL